MKVYNTLSGQKEEFLPYGDEVKVYVCGVTPYDESHIGHAMSYIIFDVIKRYLQFRGYKVKYVQNITDIDDKIIDRANKLGIPTGELAGKFADSHFEDMDALNIARADVYPRATEEIPKIIEVIQGLIDKGHAYPAQGSVYFRVGSVPDYGKLAHRSLESMLTEARVEAGKGKEYSMDFVLWKAAKPGEPSWESPWGKGRPGWHIECSAMSLKYLGDMIDIHGGGQDLIFPHHENEIAQSEGFTGAKPFVKYWLHNGLLQLGVDKMSKSIGNLITIKEALEKYSADALRIFVLGSHYRSPLTYSELALEAAESGADRLRQAVQVEGGEKKDGQVDTEPYRQRFIEAMDDDFNTAQAIAALFDLTRDINRASEAGYGVALAQQVLLELASVLGLTLEEPEMPPLDAEALQQVFASVKEAVKKAEVRPKIGAKSLYQILDEMEVNLRAAAEAATKAEEAAKSARQAAGAAAKASDEAAKRAEEALRVGERATGEVTPVAAKASDTVKAAWKVAEQVAKDATKVVASIAAKAGEVAEAVQKWGEEAVKKAEVRPKIGAKSLYQILDEMEARARAGAETVRKAEEAARLARQAAGTVAEISDEATKRAMQAVEEADIRVAVLANKISGELLLQPLVFTRDRLREAKLWQLADEIRDRLSELGIALEDTAKGAVWRRKR